jgi:hypothetical protein
LAKTISGPGGAGKREDEEGGKGSVVEQEEGKAIWFSTREETLSKSISYRRTQANVRSICVSIHHSSLEETIAYTFRCGRPYVLRDASKPFQTLTLSDRATNLEDIERRLKLDILNEARRYSGMILFHDEVSPGTLMPTWLAVDEQSVRTPQEVYEDVKQEGWRVDYFRIPIAPDRPIEVGDRASGSWV